MVLRITSSVLFISLLASAFTQGIAPGKNVPGVPIPTVLGISLLVRPDVQAELKLTAQQKQVLDKALIDYKKPDRTRGPEKSKRLKIADDTAKKTLTPAQLSRLKQLAYQRQGGFAITSPPIAKALGITKAQEKKLADVRMAGFSKFQAQPKGSKPDPKITAEIKRNLVAVLTAAQLKKWRAILGRPFKFSD